RRLANRLRQLLIANEPNYQLSTVLRPFNQEPNVAVLNLKRNSANRRRDHRLRFPHGFGDRQTKPLADRALQNHVRPGLERVDLPRPHTRGIRKEMHIQILSRIAPYGTLDFGPSGSSCAANTPTS